MVSRSSVAVRISLSGFNRRAERTSRKSPKQGRFEGVDTVFEALQLILGSLAQAYTIRKSVTVVEGDF
jgi:hypothetical protein